MNYRLKACILAIELSTPNRPDTIIVSTLP